MSSLIFRQGIPTRCMEGIFPDECIRTIFPPTSFSAILAISEIWPAAIQYRLVIDPPNQKYKSFEDYKVIPGICTENWYFQEALFLILSRAFLNSKGPLMNSLLR
jgi:hypothetical protein